MEDTLNEQIENNEETNVVDETDSEQTPEQPAEEIVEDVIPENWEQDLKDFVNGIQDKAGRHTVIEKFKNYEKGFQKKFQDLAKDRKSFESDKAFLDKYRGFEQALENRDLLIAKYGDLPTYLNKLCQMDVYASKNPEQFLINYCNNTGITAEKLQEILNGNANKQYVEKQNLERHDAELLDRWKKEQERERFEREVQEFANAKDEKGELLHPHLQELANDMDYFVSKGDSLQVAYEKAERLNPELYQEMINKKALELEQAKQVEKAKSVVGVKSATPVSSGKEKKSWRDELDDQLANEE